MNASLAGTPERGSRRTAAAVAELRKLFQKNSIAFLAAHFADSPRMFFLQHLLHPAEHFDFRAFHVVAL
jgi:hypothetical protein